MALRVTVSGASREAMADLVRVHALDIVRWTLRGDDTSGYAIDAVVDAGEADRLRALGYGVAVIEDVTARFPALQRDIAWHPADRPSWLG